jgi:hypothetical protein
VRPHGLLAEEVLAAGRGPLRLDQAHHQEVLYLAAAAAAALGQLADPEELLAGFGHPGALLLPG